jgi:hypothetical protein
MATYTRRQTPDQPVLISNVGAGDRINFLEVLGRPADKVQVYTTSATDVVEYRVNNLLIARGTSSTYGGSTSYVGRAFDQSAVVKTWLASDIFSNTGEEFELGLQLTVRSMEIVSATLSAGSTFTIICW